MVDFDPEITEIITETKMMENLGFSVPEIARNVALQEDKYIQYVDGLKRMLKRYHEVIHSLDQAEVNITKWYKTCCTYSIYYIFAK